MILFEVNFSVSYKYYFVLFSVCYVVVCEIIVIYINYKIEFS